MIVQISVASPRVKQLRVAKRGFWKLERRARHHGSGNRTGERLGYSKWKDARNRSKTRLFCAASIWGVTSVMLASFV